MDQSWPAETQETAQCSTPDDTQAASQILVPKTKEELWAAVKERTIEMFKEERDDPAFTPNPPSAQERGILAHYKIKWAIGNLAALIS
jgi:hypothetical protein